MKNKQRVELHCHSVYSERDGVSRIKDIIEFAVNSGMSAVAITDHATVAGYGEASYYAGLHDDFKLLYGMEAFVVDDLEPSVTGDATFIKESPSFHVTFLIKNEEGKRNLFELMSIAEEKYKGFKPRIPWSEIEKHREGLLVGSACEVGELYLAIMDGERDDVLQKIAARYDYIEVQPAENKLYCLDEDEVSYDEGLAYVRQFDKKIIEIAEHLGKIVVATSDAHFVLPEEAVVRAVLQRYVGYADDNQSDIHFRTTEEMLKCFDYLGKDKAREIVIDNTNKIADLIENIKVSYMAGEHYPKLDDAYERLKKHCDSKIKDVYGNEPPQEALDQLNWELHSLMESGSDSIMLLAKELVEESGLKTYEFGYRGCLGSMISAYLCGITCVNPLESKMLLYPEFLIGINGDKTLDVDFNFPITIRNTLQEACNDLEEIGSAFRAGTIKTFSEDEARAAIDEYEEYHGVFHETNKREWIIERLTNVTKGRGMSPGAVMLVPEWYEITEFTPVTRVTANSPLMTEVSYHDLGNMYWFDILSNNHINMLYELTQRTEVNVADISLDDTEVGAVLGGFGKISALGIPEFDSEYVRSVAKEYGVNSFIDIVQVICLVHGTNVWENNAEDLIHQEGFTKASIVASREDIFECLLALGISRKEAFHIAEFVRKGKARPTDVKWQKYRKIITDSGAPDWFVFSCEKIRYMFSRTHSYIYALHAWWITWFKLYYPKEFYETYMKLLASDGLKQIVDHGKDAFNSYKAGYFDAISDGFCSKEIGDTNIEELLVAEEMLEILE